MFIISNLQRTDFARKKMEEHKSTDFIQGKNKMPKEGRT